MKEKYKEQYKYGKYIENGFVFIAIIKLFIGLLRTIIFTRGYERHYLDILEGKQKKYSISLVSMNSKKEEANYDNNLLKFMNIYEKNWRTVYDYIMNIIIVTSISNIHFTELK